MHNGGDADGAGRAERVAEGDGATERIHLGRIDAEFLHHCDRLRGEGFIELDPVQLILRDANLRQHLGDRRDRADAHDLGRHAADGVAGKAGQRRQVVFAQNSFRNQHHGTGAIGHLRRIPGRHRTARMENRLQLGQLVECRIGARTFVGIGDALTDADFAGGQIRQAFAHRVGRNFGLEVTGGNRRTSPAVRLDGKCILRLATDLPLVGHLFGGKAHAVGDAEVFLFRENGRVHRRLVAHDLRHDAHRLGTGGDHHVGQAKANLVGGIGHGLHPGGAKAVDGDARHSDRQPGQQKADTGDVHALLGFRHGAADDDIADQCRVDARHLGDN